MNIYKFEIKGYFRTLWIWVLSLLALLLMYMAFYPVMSDDAQMMDKILEHYPEELLKAFGMGGSISLATVFGFFTFTFVFVQLCLAVQSAYYGFNFLSIEERELTADFLYSKPVTRRSVFIQKYLAALTALIISDIAVWIGSFLAIEIFRGDNTYEINNLLILLVSIPIFQLFFFSIGLIVTTVSKKISSVISYAMALSFGLYILNAIRSIVGGELLGMISPYYYFEPGYILTHGKLNFKLTLIAVAVILISNIIGYRLYMKRNIHSL